MLCLSLGCKDEPASQQPKALEAQSTRTNTLTPPSPQLPQVLSAYRKIDETPLQRNPARRPLILSQPAANRHQWAVETLLRGYRDTGKTNAAWDAKVERAFNAYADYTRRSVTNWPALERDLAIAVATGCDDPLLRYMRARYATNQPPADQSALEFLGAHDAMVASKHHPLFKFMAGWRAVDAARAADTNAWGGVRVARTTADLEDLARDTHAPAAEVFEAAGNWLNHQRGKKWTEFMMHQLESLLKTNRSETEPWFRFVGGLEVRRAWDDRGGGYVSKVTAQGWRGFEEHLNKAEEALTRAWQMDTNQTDTAYQMMRVELGQGQGRDRMEMWFNRVMSLDTNNHEGVALMAFYLEPRWYGSESQALDFARACVASKEWGGRVPLILAELHESLAKYYQMTASPEYWHRSHVWADVKSSYEKFFAINPEAVGWRHNYARDAYLCGQHATFLEQTRLFKFGTNQAFFGGAARFQEMLKKASEAGDGAR